MLTSFILSASEEIKPDSPEGVYHFAQNLYKYGEYRRAATEYLRYFSLYSHRTNANEVLFRAALSFEKANEFENARKFYDILAKRNDNSSLAVVIDYRHALNFFLEHNNDSTLLYIESSSNKDEVAMLYLEGMCHISQREYTKAELIYERLSKNENRELSSSIHYLMSKSRQGKNLPNKSPIAAGVLSSIVPGSGRAYCDNWSDAFFSFLAVAATIAPAVYFYDDDKAFAITTGIAGGFFYFGNIYGSIIGAKNYNENTHQKFLSNTLDGVPYPPQDINSNPENL